MPSASRKTTCYMMGSISCAVTTSWAFFSTKVVTVLTLAGRIGGLLGTSPLMGAFFLAQANNFCIFSCFVSDLYLWASLSSWVNVWWSKAWVNWLMAGRAFKYLIENSPLLLQPNVRRALDKAGEGPFRAGCPVQCQNSWAFSQWDVSPSWPPALSQQQGLVPSSFP